MKYLHIPYNSKLKEFARELRNNSTPAEIELWKELKGDKLGVRFNRQVPLDEFIVDFYCYKLRLAIEVDGKIHDYQFQYDGDRQHKLETEYGVEFLRFSNDNVVHHKNAVIGEIVAKIAELEKGDTF